jgi:hypothetical protein
MPWSVSQLFALAHNHAHAHAILFGTAQFQKRQLGSDENVYIYIYIYIYTHTYIQIKIRVSVCLNLKVMNQHTPLAQHSRWQSLRLTLTLTPCYLKLPDVKYASCYILSHLGGDGKISSLMVHCFTRCVIRLFCLYRVYLFKSASMKNQVLMPWTLYFFGYKL